VFVALRRRKLEQGGRHVNGDFPSPALREKVPKADEGLLERQLKIALTLALSRKRERGKGG